ncbi:DUF4907 domain-containing protein [Hymenobacter busanensis]|uniref:DUF4907 domain-containing protein n=1 Tax=Hymenobacter busanensis TaxID=2607656 RepID=A0A7L4ZSU1_9BACT|nr:DUF4907 domain-containing protein [Hymenobacter busanensis]KAA9327169.1 DUF4907 domain-containing protein [Hymenobacter busanensis]QHJ05835.1 DUF4907 domain-containing protein [Hymenobacter busanensis]
MLLRHLFPLLTAGAVAWAIYASPAPPAASAAFSYRLLPAAGATIGYEISQQNRPLIRQLTVPGRGGTQGFRSAADADAVARLVVTKLARGLMPPAVTAHELDSLGVAP